jgi:FkbM family methyltransferase
MKTALFHLGNKLYEHCYPAYYPLYSAWKAFSDRAERKLLKQILQPGMTVADVGANIGIYTRFFAAQLGGHGRVHAFEPGPANFKHLQKNTRRLSNASLNHAAVGEHNGTIKLFISDELNVDHRTFDNGEGRDSIDVPMVSLDDYFSPGQRVDLIKLDVQGYEMSVLSGAQRILTENADIKLLMEFWPYGLKQAGVKPMDLLDFFKSRGFHIKLVAKTLSADLDDEIRCTPADPGYYCNLLIRKKQSIN